MYYGKWEKKFDFSYFSDFSNFWKINGKKKFNYNEKKFCAEKIEFWATAQVYCKARQLGWARLLGVQALGTRGASRRAQVGAVVRGHGRMRRHAWRARQADAG